MKQYQKQKQIVNFRITKKQHENIKRLAHKTERSLSDFIRESIAIAQPHSKSPTTWHKALSRAIQQSQNTDQKTKPQES